ncbi:MAG: NrfD/PsrC family molybdoenzyme membrane anchor subunit [Planctomycetota bacterium]
MRGYKPFYPDNLGEPVSGREPLVLGPPAESFGAVTEVTTRQNFKLPSYRWLGAFAVAFTLLQLLPLTQIYLFAAGPGVWGNNNPVAWGFPIVNFVFWVGIGHAGTLISAILFLLRQNWRTSINRFAEAMTIFAVICAGMYPGIHIGRPWLAYWLFPIPNQMAMWPQFRSPLMWDVFAVSTYASVSALFWYLGMVPDLATLRDKAKTRIQQVAYGALSLGWNGSARHWHRFEKMYLLLAALCTPLVLSVHSVVSFDFAVSQLPGWHTTIFPPYFVAGAVFGGFAMVLTLAIPARWLFGLEGVITKRHIENMNRILLLTGCIVSFAYITEFFIAWYSGHHYEQFQFLYRPFGDKALFFYAMMFCNVIAPQVLWSSRMRKNLWVTMAVAMCVNFGMWFERFVIIIISLEADFLPSSWGAFWPTWVDWAMFAGTFGLFFTNMLLFVRVGPIIALAEVKSIMPQAHIGHSTHETNAHPEAKEDMHPEK